MEVFEQILYMGGAATVVIIAVLLVRVLMKHFSRKYAYFLWLIVGIRLVCPIAVSSSLSVFNLQFLPEQSREAWMAAVADVQGEMLSGQEEVFGDTFDVLPDETHKITVTEGDYTSIATEHSLDTSGGMKKAGAGTIPGEDASADSFQETGNSSVISKVFSAAARIWLAGMLLLLLWNVYLTVRMHRRLRSAVLYRDNIYECDGIATPFVFGLLRPRIYIPFRLGEEEREYILHHEQYHIRRRDYIAKAAAFLILTVYWFHPLVWVSYFCMVRDMEMSCDEYVLASMGQDIRKKYSQSLLAFATNQRHLSMGLLAFGETGTRKRIRHILNFRKKGKWMGILAGIVVLVAAAACLTNGTTEGREKKELEKDNRAILTSEMVNGYETRLLLKEGEKITEAESPYNGMYEGRFALVTYNNGEKCDEQELTALDGKEKLYFPEKFSLCVRDYDEDGKADDFALGQPSDSSAMAYSFYTVEENGSIMKYNVSIQNTVPDDDTFVREMSNDRGEDYIIVDKSSSEQDSWVFSPEFSAKYGLLSYSSYEQDTGESKEEICMLIKRLDEDRSLVSELNIVQKTEEMIRDTAPQRVVDEMSGGVWAKTATDKDTAIYTYTKENNGFCVWIGVENGKLISYSLISYGIKKEIPEDPVTEEQAYDTVRKFAKAFSGVELAKEELKNLSGTVDEGSNLIDLNEGDSHTSTFSAGNNKLVLGDSQGGIYIVDLKHNMVEQFQNSGPTGIGTEDSESAEKMESVEDQIRIGFWRPEDGTEEPVYYGGGEKMEKLQKLAEELDPDCGCTKAMEKKLQKEKKTGYILSYKGNDWTVCTGGYVAFLYGKDEKDDPEQNAVMYLPELCKEADKICKEELDYQRIEPSTIKDVVSAELSYKKKDGTYIKQTLTKKAKLGTLEKILSEAEEMGGSSACPFGTAVLTLQLKNGKEIQLTWADDSCRVIRINGIYYEYMDRHLSFSPHGIRALFDKIPWKGLS